MASAQITAVAKDNLFLIFGETDAAKRRDLFEKLWHPDGEFTFIEPDAVSTTYEQVDAIITGLQKNAVGFVFETVGDVQILKTAGDETVARLKWGFGPPGESYKVTGEDVFTITKGKIKKLFTFID